MSIGIYLIYTIDIDIAIYNVNNNYYITVNG